MADPNASTTLHLESYTPDAKAVVASAQSLADELKHAEVEPVHLLVRALQRDAGVAEVVRRAGADPGELLHTAEAAMRRLPRTDAGEAYLSGALLELLRRAEREAQRDRAASVGLEQVLIALSQEIRGAAGEALAAFHIVPGAFRPHLAALHATPRDALPGARSDGASEATVGAYTRDLASLAKSGDPVIGRTSEVRRALQILERRSKSHPLLVGEAGVGKGAVVRALAARISAGDAPANLVGSRLVELDVGAILAGAKLRGEVEDRLKALLRSMAAEGARGEAVLVIEGIAELLGQGAVGAGIGDVLRPLLTRGELRVVATTTPEGLRRMHDRDSALVRRFSVITIEPATLVQSQDILRGVAARYEQHHGVRIGEGAIIASVRLAARYVQDRALPDSAIDLLDEASARKRVENEGLPADLDSAVGRLASLEAQRASLVDDTDRVSVEERTRIDTELATLGPDVARRRSELEAKRKASQTEGGGGDERLVTEEDVARTLETWTGIPVQRMLEGEADKLLKMEDRLRRRIVGQDEAVAAIARAVRRGRVGLRDPGRPIGSFLFLGPSGVGKTELAKALAAFLFDDEQALTRLDMSEFMERHMAQRLLGAPPGYVDSEQGGFLTEAVRRRPYSVLLFDEVEKAHSDVFNLLLQVLDDGRLTDGRGRTADFSNTVLIMTSNIGSARILETDTKMWATEEGKEALRDVLSDELKAFFRPEFLNRVDDVVVFRPLAKHDLLGIVDIQLARLGSLLAARRLSIRVSDEAKAKLVDLGYEPAYGARPLKRAIVKELQDPLAEAILRSNYPEESLIDVGVEKGEFVFKGPV